MYKVGSEEWNEKIREIAKIDILRGDLKEIENLMNSIEVDEEKNVMRINGEEYEIPKYGTPEWEQAYKLILDERIKLPKPYLLGLPEWTHEFERMINEGPHSEEYKDAAKDWEGDIALHILPAPDLGLDTDLYIYMGLYHGEARPGSLRLVSKDDAEKAAYVITGTYDQWIDVQRGKIGVIKALMKGDMTLKGDLKKLMKQTKPARLLIDMTEDVGSISFDELDDERFELFKIFLNKFRPILGF
ncbi:MAG: hypothetical protein EF806_01300 [Candidatus Methanoliparum thermophilum]|uniref:SCP2 domain-containing protein n=1 Tax=Methanoliparum thermophilum TaxID=2491083 RepID=A0A520KTZ1_METT2|nr:SCP2 sterol-binding domain-containing protein [Candidatus Methanoliparum sp. LAM-1]RZN65553.1 MAG: hypothetical protein EF806_01300 [Candidatus Methanoliparum thermophilum]BDC35349.1 hypothetical protein MTLP_00310 [Candidatus Methanoliparum sp. LAM-1]